MKRDALASFSACPHVKAGSTRPLLLRLLRSVPSAEVIAAVAAVADEECIVLLGRIAQTMPELSAAALDALATIDDPRQPGALRQKSATTTRKTDRDMDQSTDSTAENPSLN